MVVLALLFLLLLLAVACVLGRVPDSRDLRPRLPLQAPHQPRDLSPQQPVDEYLVADERRTATHAL